MFVLGWGRVYLDCWWELGMVGKTRPYRIIGMFDCFGKIWVRGDRMFVVGWGRVYLDCWWELGMVGKTRPYRIIGMFDCFGKIWVRGDRLLGKFWLEAIECLSLGGGGFIYIVNDRDYCSFAPNSFSTDFTKSSRGINRGIFAMI